MARDRIEIYKDKAGEFRWRRVARNGRIVADSGEGYVSATNAIRAVKSRYGNEITIDIQIKGESK
jgi:uncharacterized protein YegP (UPF0339 family)